MVTLLCYLYDNMESFIYWIANKNTILAILLVIFIVVHTNFTFWVKVRELVELYNVCE